MIFQLGRFFYSVSISNWRHPRRSRQNVLQNNQTARARKFKSCWGTNIGHSQHSKQIIHSPRKSGLKVVSKHVAILQRSFRIWQLNFYYVLDDQFLFFGDVIEMSGWSSKQSSFFSFTVRLKWRENTPDQTLECLVRFFTGTVQAFHASARRRGFRRRWVRWFRTRRRWRRPRSTRRWRWSSVGRCSSDRRSSAPASTSRRRRCWCQTGPARAGNEHACL